VVAFKNTFKTTSIFQITYTLLSSQLPFSTISAAIESCAPPNARTLTPLFRTQQLLHLKPFDFIFTSTTTVLLYNPNF
jgi:hypothetical protein